MSAADKKAPPLQIRGLTDAAYNRFRTGAAARGMTQAQYLERLLELHHTMMALTTSPDAHEPVVAAVLEKYGLGPVTA